MLRVITTFNRHIRQQTRHIVGMLQGSEKEPDCKRVGEQPQERGFRQAPQGDAQDQA